MNRNYTIKIIQQEHYLHIVVQGNVNHDSDADQMQADMIELIRNHPFKTKLILLDIRQLQGRGSVTNTFFRAASVPNDMKMLRIALLESPEYEQSAKITETMYRNSGANIQLFIDQYKAEEWLSELKVLGF